MALFAPQNVLNTTNQFYGQFLQSPAYAQALQHAYTGGNALQNTLAASLGARGLGSTGIGAIAPGLATSAASGMAGQVRTQGYDQAQHAAFESLLGQLHGLSAAGPPPQSAFAQGIGGGIQDFSQFLGNYLLPRGGQPSMPYGPTTGYPPYSGYPR